MAHSHVPVPSPYWHGIAFLLLTVGLCLPGLALKADGLSIGSELDLGTWSPFVSQWESLSTVCAWSDGAYDSYKVTASSLAAGSDFELTNGIGDSVAYSVYWRDEDSSGAWEQLLFDVLSTDAYAYADAAQCIGGPTAEVRVEIDKADIDAAIPGTYSDTLLLTLTSV